MNYRRQLSSSQAASSAASSSSSEPPSFSSVSVSTPVTSLTSTSVSASLPPQQVSLAFRILSSSCPHSSKASSAGPSTAKQVDSSTTKKPAASSTPDEPSDPPTTTKKSTTTKPLSQPADTSNTPDPPSSTTTKPVCCLQRALLIPTDTSDTPDPPNSSAGSTANPPPSTSRKLTTTSASSAASAAQSAQPPRATSDSPAAQSSGVNRDEDNAASVSIEVSSASDPGPSQSQSQSQSKSQPASESQSASSDPPDSSTPASSASQSDSSASLSESASASASDSASLPLPSSSDSGIPSTLLANNTVSADLSTLLTTFTTEINGQLTTVRLVSLLHPPSTLPRSPPPRSSINSVQRTAIIAGATAAGVGILLLCLGAVFLYKRHKSRKREFSEALGRFRRETQGAGGVGLLDDEFDDDDDNVPMRRYRDAVGHSPSQSRDLNMSSTSLGPPQSPAPSLFRQRAETGSLFREEGVWPPPGSNFVDPLVGLGAGDGLTRIVDDVMGPAPSSAHARDSPSAYSGLGVLNTNADGTPRDRPHTASMSSMYNDPFRDVSLNPPPYDPSQYYDRSGSSLSTHSQQTSGGSTGSGDRSPTPQSLLGLPAGAAAPKKSSPLVNMSAKAASPTPSPPPPTLPSAGTWLTRSPRKQAIRLSGEESTG
ncbi:hypothetical protein R3P38DRAFT_3038767 [Favolaschia claudopus]|uniref:Uncharacterized protein n=1 Tax=Favolaschia claudopus TaxID=2862362 RepID=A0AAW0AAT9_9AGAR